MILKLQSIVAARLRAERNCENSRVGVKGVFAEALGVRNDVVRAFLTEDESEVVNAVLIEVAGSLGLKPPSCRDKPAGRRSPLGQARINDIRNGKILSQYGGGGKDPATQSQPEKENIGGSPRSSLTLPHVYTRPRVRIMKVSNAYSLSCHQGRTSFR